MHRQNPEFQHVAERRRGAARPRGLHRLHRVRSRTPPWAAASLARSWAQGRAAGGEGAGGGGKAQVRACCNRTLQRQIVQSSPRPAQGRAAQGDHSCGGPRSTGRRRRRPHVHGEGREVANTLPPRGSRGLRQDVGGRVIVQRPAEAPRAAQLTSGTAIATASIVAAATAAAAKSPYSQRSLSWPPNLLSAA